MLAHGRRFWGESLSVCTNGATRIQTMRLQILKKLHPGIEVIHVNGEMGPIVGSGQIHHDPVRKALLPRPLTSGVDLEVGHISGGALSHDPHLDAPLGGFEREILPEGESPLELHHAFIHAHEAIHFIQLLESTGQVGEEPSDFPELVRAVHILVVIVLQVEIPENVVGQMVSNGK